MNDFRQNSKSDSEILPGNGPVKERSGKIAKSQRIVLFFILMFFPMILMSIALFRSGWPGGLVTALYGFIIAYIIFSYVHMVLLSYRVYGLGMTILCGILFWLLLPLGFILLAIVNSGASKILKKEGYKVGLLGVSPKAFK
ncbi:MAG: hypothetical protein R2941_25535 [Desulfobacterales bacterium]